jgi:hypothetical protein
MAWKQWLGWMSAAPRPAAAAPALALPGGPRAASRVLPHEHRIPRQLELDFRGGAAAGPGPRLHAARTD